MPSPRTAWARWASACLILTVGCGHRTVDQDVAFKIIGDLDPDGVAYVSTPARDGPEGIEEVTTWIPLSGHEGRVTVKTLDPLRTTVGYWSRARIPVELPVTGSVAQLVLVPIENAKGVTKRTLELAPHETADVGLRLEEFEFDPHELRLRLAPIPPAKLYEVAPERSAWVCRRGVEVPAATRSGNFVLESDGKLWLVSALGWSETQVILDLYLQPRPDAEFLHRTFEECRSYVDSLSEKQLQAKRDGTWIAR